MAEEGEKRKQKPLTFAGKYIIHIALMSQDILYSNFVMKIDN